MDPRPGTVAALVSRRHNSLFDGNALELLPGVSHFDPVDAPSPWVIRDVARRSCFGRVSKGEDFRRCSLAQPAQPGFDLAQNGWRQFPAEIASKNAVVGVLIA